MNRSLSIDVPAAASYLRLVRMLVGAFAAEGAGLDVEAAARVRLAASEACVALLAAVPDGTAAPGTVHVGTRVEGDCVDLEVRLATPSPVEGRDLVVLRLLADDVEIRAGGDEQVVALRLHVGGRAGADV